jgi:hypothetical protein
MMIIEKKPKRLGGINIAQLDVGSRIDIQTLNNLYIIKLLGGNRIMIQGGHLNKPVAGMFVGSCGRASLIKQNWIGKGMRMEITYDGKKLLTSKARGARVVGDVWLYELWD